MTVGLKTETERIQDDASDTETSGPGQLEDTPEAVVITDRCATGSARKNRRLIERSLSLTSGHLDGHSGFSRNAQAKASIDIFHIRYPGSAFILSS